MPLDNSNYISEMNINNPVGNVDTVSMTDDFFREMKKTIKQSFPNINKQTTITSDELNNLKAYMVRSGSSWNVQNSVILGVAASDDATAVNPRSYNDNRYAIRSNNLADIPDKSAAMNNLIGGLPVGSQGWAVLRNMVANMLYQVGCLYFDTSGATNPRDRFGVGTWVQFAQGRTLVGVGSTGDDRGEGRGFGLGQTGGEFAHVLSWNEMPAHSHQIIVDDQTPAPWGTNNSQAARYDADSDDDHWAKNINTSSAGSNWAHNNMQPYIAVYIWQRTG